LDDGYGIGRWGQKLMEIIDHGALVTVALALISGGLQAVMFASRWQEVVKWRTRGLLLVSGLVTLYFSVPYMRLATGAPPTIGANQIRPAIDMLLLATALLVAFTYRYHRSIAVLEETRQQRVRDVEEGARRLKIAEEERERLSHSISQMQAIWFHEARTPLTAFMSSLVLLRDPAYADASIEILDRMEVMYRRMSLYIDYLSALETAVVHILFDLAGVISVVLDGQEIYTATRRKRGDVTIHYDRPVPLLIQADQSKITAVVVELIRNAIKFNMPGGEIYIDVYRTNGDVALIVRDTGIGIEEADHERIFGIGFQVDNSNTRRYEGHGFGLAMVRRVVLAHYGSIRVESALGQGSVFVVRLPRHE
jgi:signal transduction histidine kinase